MKMLIALLIIPALACGVAAPLPAVMAGATMPAIATQTPAKAPVIVTATEIHANAEMTVTGCWNIRTSPADLQGANIIRVQCGGTVTVIQWAANGYLELGGGEYVCNQAVGMERGCR